MTKYCKEPLITVRCNQCGETHDEKDVEFVNIEEDMFGADLLTFKCPNPDCHGTSQSNRYGGN
jgi:hypothetical protein